ncbi:hypothetical protein OROGR_009232 [Orobanche gracilis]
MRPAAFRPRPNASASYTPLIEKGRPVLQGLLAIDFLAKEVLGWAQAMPKFSTDLINYVQTFLERTYERCRTSYMEAVLEKQSYMLIGRHDIDNLLRLDPAGACLHDSLGKKVRETDTSGVESTEVDTQLSEILLNLRPIKQENLIRDDSKLILLASLSDSLEYVADSIERLGKSSVKSYDHLEENGSSKHTRASSAPPKDLPSFAEEYRNLAIDCLKVLRIEMQLETIFRIQEMAKREYLDDQDAEEPDDFVISLTSQQTPLFSGVFSTVRAGLTNRQSSMEVIDRPAFSKPESVSEGMMWNVDGVESSSRKRLRPMNKNESPSKESISPNVKPHQRLLHHNKEVTRRDEEIAPFVADVKRNYIFGGICGVAANLSIKALAEMKSINLFGVQQICRNSIALEQALAAISSIDGEVVQMRLDRVRTYYELLNMPFEALLAFISEHGQLFSAAEYANLLKVQVPGREIPDDAQDRATEIMSH